MWRYSLNNQLLILAQAAEWGTSPTLAAGYKTRRSRGRQVPSGQKGLSILVPAGRFLVELDETDHLGEDQIVEQPGGTKSAGIRPPVCTVAVWAEETYAARDQS